MLGTSLEKGTQEFQSRAMQQKFPRSFYVVLKQVNVSQWSLSPV